jgi:two-component system chemotaxis response regulator CheB
VEYRCRVGHAYSPETAVAAHYETEEDALWAAMVTLEKGADLNEQVSELGRTRKAGDLRKDAELKRILSKEVREVIDRLLKDQQARL